MYKTTNIIFFLLHFLLYFFLHAYFLVAFKKLFSSLTYIDFSLIWGNLVPQKYSESSKWLIASIFIVEQSNLKRKQYFRPKVRDFYQATATTLWTSTLSIRVLLFSVY